MVCRTLFVRVRPDTIIAFEPNEDAEDAPGSKRSFLSRIKAGVNEDHSLFGWADKGAWKTAESPDEEAKRVGDWFRIGFEPVFVDFTKTGSWFAAFALVQVCLIRI